MVITKEYEDCAHEFEDLHGADVDMSRLSFDPNNGFPVYDGNISPGGDATIVGRKFQFFEYAVEQPITVSFELYPEAKRLRAEKQARMQHVLEGLEEPVTAMEKFNLELRNRESDNEGIDGIE